MAEAERPQRNHARRTWPPRDPAEQWKTQQISTAASRRIPAELRSLPRHNKAKLPDARKLSSRRSAARPCDPPAANVLAADAHLLPLLAVEEIPRTECGADDNHGHDSTNDDPDGVVAIATSTAARRLGC